MFGHAAPERHRQRAGRLVSPQLREGPSLGPAPAPSRPGSPPSWGGGSADRHARRRHPISGRAGDHPRCRRRPAAVYGHGPRHQPAPAADQEREELMRLEQVPASTPGGRDQLEAILSGVADAVTAQAPDGRLLFANDAAVELLGFDSSRGAAVRGAGGDHGPLRDPRRAGQAVPTGGLPGRRALVLGEACAGRGALS